MNEILAIIFLCFGLIILFKKIVLSVMQPILESSNIKLLGFLALVVGGFLLYIVDFSWSDRIWKNTLFVFGLFSILRGFIAIFFENMIHKFANLLFNNYYKFTIPLSLLFFSLALLMVSRDYMGPLNNIDECQSDESISVYCGFKNPEDMALLPDNKFFIMSEFGGIKPYQEIDGEGSFALLRISDGARILPIIKFEENIWGDPGCKRNPADAFGPHGIDLIKRDDGLMQLGVVNHLPFESVEFFELTQNGDDWSMTWRGCVVAPEENYFNDLSIRRDGSFYVTHMYERDITVNEWLSAALFKYSTGYVLKWDNNNFSKVIGSDGGQPNGIGLDEDSELLYVNYNLSDELKVINLLNGSSVGRYSINSPDNMIILDNSIWLTSLDHETIDSMGCDLEISVSCSLPFSIHEIDVVSLKKKNIYSFQETVFGFPTTAYPLNNKIYIGSFHSDRMAFFQTD
tara:strand:+ start:5150 stop:6523 length:1374 start_codon:yes stop_codon:yes gene_type:complete